MSNFKNAQLNFGLVKHYAIIRWNLTTNYLGGSASTSGHWSQLSAPPPEECFKSKLNKKKPVCSKLIRFQENCEKCKKSWKLHEKMMIRMAKNRAAAAKSRTKRLKALRDLKLNNKRLKAQAKACDVELANANKQNESLIEEIEEKWKDREVLLVERDLFSV